MDQIDYRKDLELFDEIWDHLIGPTPVKALRLRFDPVPWHAPANCLQTEILRERQVFAPMLVVTHQLVFVERTVTGPRLRYKRILDARRPKKVVGWIIKGFLHP